jgi:phosphoribosylanthranilate isomerase
MALQTLVLVSNITNLSDARYCAGMGVEMLGFTLDLQDSSYVEPGSFKAITEWVAGIHTVGVIPQTDAQDAKELIQAYPVDYMMTETSTDWPALREIGIPLLCQVLVDGDFTAQWFTYHYAAIQPYVDYFVLVSKQDAISNTVVEQITTVSAEFPLILGFGIHEQTVQSLLKNTSLKGIALKGSHEIRPGFKDFDDLATILELLEVEE